MSCPNASSPIDIVHHSTEKCDLKCDYLFNYIQSSVRVENRGDHLIFSFDHSNDAPVMYNSEKYNVGRMRLYQPSLHTWNGQRAKAELVIEHSAVAGTKNLLVCVPVDISGKREGALDTIIEQVAKTAPNQGGITNIVLPSFTLNNIVPRSSFYSYKGTLPYSPCNGVYSYVVFGLNNGIGITKNTETLIKKLITVSPYSIKRTKSGVFYNSKGAGSLVGNKNGEDEIYIECHPTGDDGETLVPEKKDIKRITIPGEVEDYAKKIWDSGILGALLGAIVLIVLFKVFHIVLRLLFGTGNGSKVESSTVLT